LSSPKSDCLYHFTSIEASLRIFAPTDFHFLPSYSLEDFRLFIANSLWAMRLVPMVCFCDIPVDRCDEHAQNYGPVGIGIKKEWAFRQKVAPVQYVLDGTRVHDVLDALFARQGQRAFSDETISGILSYTKPFRGSLWDKNILSHVAVRCNVEFYQECEWRYVPEGMASQWHSPFSTKEWLEMNAQAISERLARKLSFELADIIRIVVSPRVEKDLRTKLGNQCPSLLPLIHCYHPSADPVPHRPPDHFQPTAQDLAEINGARTDETA
jgi:hypothetical protein